MDPQEEACDGLDNDCDGEVDEGCDEGGGGGGAGGSGGGGTGGAGGSGGTAETGGVAGSGGTAGTGGGPGECVVIPAYGGSFPYKTYALNAAPTNFWQFAFDDADFQQGNAPFGSGGDCSIQLIVETHWPSPSDIVLRKHIQLTDTSLPLRILVAIDNALWVFLNENDVSGGLQPHEDCADTNHLEFVIPTSAMRLGDNLLAVLGRDRHVEAALDIELAYDQC